MTDLNVLEPDPNLSEEEQAEALAVRPPPNAAAVLAAQQIADDIAVEQAGGGFIAEQPTVPAEPGKGAPSEGVLSQLRAAGMTV